MRERGEYGPSSAASEQAQPQSERGGDLLASFLYPRPFLPPPPLGTRALGRSSSSEAPSSRRAKQNTLARIRLQQWHEDELDADEDENENENEDPNGHPSDRKEMTTMTTTTTTTTTMTKRKRKRRTAPP